MPFELSVVQEPLAAAFVSALEQLVSMDCVVLLQGRTVKENLPARV